MSSGGAQGHSCCRPLGSILPGVSMGGLHRDDTGSCVRILVYCISESLPVFFIFKNLRLCLPPPPPQWSGSPWNLLTKFHHPFKTGGWGSSFSTNSGLADRNHRNKPANQKNKSLISWNCINPPANCEKAQRDATRPLFTPLPKSE